MLFPSDFGE